MLQSHARPDTRKAHPREARPARNIACALLALLGSIVLDPTGASAATPTDPDQAGVAVAESDSLTPPADGLLERALQPEPESRPLDPELQAVLDRERAELDRLRARFENAPDHAAAIAAQQAIDTLKQHTEIELLQIQARRMRERGLEEQATELEQSVASMLARLPRRSEVQDVPAAADPR